MMRTYCEANDCEVIKELAEAKARIKKLDARQCAWATGRKESCDMVAGANARIAKLLENERLCHRKIDLLVADLKTASARIAELEAQLKNNTVLSAVRDVCLDCYSASELCESCEGGSRHTTGDV